MGKAEVGGRRREKHGISTAGTAGEEHMHCSEGSLTIWRSHMVPRSLAAASPPPKGVCAQRGGVEQDTSVSSPVKWGQGA
jgi:hypothetical protein